MRQISREENFAVGKFREIPFAVDIYFAGGKFRAKSKFANIANISSTRKLRVIELVHTTRAYCELAKCYAATNISYLVSM